MDFLGITWKIVWNAILQTPQQTCGIKHSTSGPPNFFLSKKIGMILMNVRAWELLACPLSLLRYLYVALYLLIIHAECLQSMYCIICRHLNCIWILLYIFKSYFFNLSCVFLVAALGEQGPHIKAQRYSMLSVLMWMPVTMFQDKPQDLFLQGPGHFVFTGREAEWEAKLNPFRQDLSATLCLCQGAKRFWSLILHCLLFQALLGISKDGSI